jgi:hypothetical protein
MKLSTNGVRDGQTHSRFELGRRLVRMPAPTLSEHGAVSVAQTARDEVMAFQWVNFPQSSPEP